MRCNSDSTALVRRSSAGCAFDLAVERLPFKIAAIAATPATSIEAKIVQNCASDLSLAEEDVVYVCRQESTLGWWREALKAVSTSDVVIFHSPLIFSVILVVITKLCRKRIVSLVWDVYPVRLNGRRYDKRLIRRGIDLLERFCLANSDLILVPSPDFLKEPSLADAEFVPMWVEPKLTHISWPGSTAASQRGADEVLKILFAGQVNETRALDHALERLKQVLPIPFLLRVASFDKLPDSLLSNRQVEFLGGLSPCELGSVATNCDFGLVSLSPVLDGAGFPSKTFDYLGFGLPVLYSGPRLECFIRLIEETGVGLDVSKRDNVSVAELRELQSKIISHRKLFFRETRLKPGSMSRTLSRFANRP
jgi:hypothetical protein